MSFENGNENVLSLMEFLAEAYHKNISTKK